MGVVSKLKALAKTWNGSSPSGSSRTFAQLSEGSKNPSSRKLSSPRIESSASSLRIYISEFDAANESTVYSIRIARGDSVTVEYFEVEVAHPNASYVLARAINTLAMS